MRKTVLAAGLCIAALATGCGGKSVAQESYDALESQNESLQTNQESLQAALESVQGDYDSYKESMSSYEGLSQEEAEARQIQAESVKASQEAAEQAAKESSEAESRAIAESEEAASIAAEQAGYDTGITYDQLARTPDDYKGQKVKFHGKVLQVMEDNVLNLNSIRLAVDGDYDKVVYATYISDIVSSRILENDMITIYGVSSGLRSYTTVMGSTVTIPEITIDKIDQ